MILKKRVQHFYERFISLRDEPARIAAGIAIGVFVGVTPTIPFHTAIIILISLVFRQNLTAGYLGTWVISNPLTIPLFYLSQYEIGRFLLGMERCRFDLDDFTLGSIATLGWQVFIPLLTGGILMAPLFAVIAYWISYHLIHEFRKRGTS